MKEDVFLCADGGFLANTALSRDDLVLPIFFIPVLLAMAPAYLWRMRRRGGYRENFDSASGDIRDWRRKRRARGACGCKR